MDYEKLLILINSYKISHALFIAADLKLFDYTDGENSLIDIAEYLQVNQKALEILLDLFVSIQVVEKDDSGVYSLKDELKPLLRSNHSNSLIPLMKLEGYLSESHTSKKRLKDVIEKGIGIDSFNKNKKENQANLYSEAMNNGGRFASICVARELLALNKGNILDVGGGAGTYSIQACKLNPNLKATIVDKEEMKASCLNNIKSANLMDRICFVEGDLYEYDLKGRYEGIIVSNLLHLFDDITNRCLIKKLAQALQDNGIIVFHDFFLSKDESKNLISTIYTLDWMMHGAFFNATPEKIASWITPYGLEVINLREYKELPTSIIIAKKKSF